MNHRGLLLVLEICGSSLFCYNFGGKFWSVFFCFYFVKSDWIRKIEKVSNFDFRIKVPLHCWAMHICQHKTVAASVRSQFRSELCSLKTQNSWKPCCCCYCTLSSNNWMKGQKNCRNWIIFNEKKSISIVLISSSPPCNTIHLLISLNALQKREGFLFVTAYP